MEQYIDKSALVAEIDKITKALYRQNPDEFGDETQFLAAAEIGTLNLVKDIIDILEVKEVDLEKEYKDFVEKDPVYNKLVNGIVGKAIAKHFFKLGLKAQKGE